MKVLSPKALRSVSVESFGGLFENPSHGVAFPHSRITVLIELGSGSSSVGGVPLRALLVGLQSKPTIFEQHGVVDCVELRLPPSFALRLGLGLSEMADSLAPVEHLFGRSAESLRSELAETDSAARPDLLNALLQSQLVRRDKTRLEEVLEAIEDRTAGVGIAALAEVVGCSRSTLWRQMTASLGMTPNQFISLRRFECGASLLAGGVPIGRAAAQAGYVDQSHFHRHVRRFAGMTPMELASQTGATFVQDIDAWSVG